MSRTLFAPICITLGLTAACAAEPNLGEPSDPGEVAAPLDARQGPPAARAPVDVADEPPPRSEPARVAPAAAQDAQAERDGHALAALRGSFARAGAHRIVAARGRVAAVEAIERPLPEALGWGPDITVATRIRIDVDEPLCGAAGTSLTAWYVGGVLPDGRGVRTSQMTSDPEAGEDAVFWLEHIRGELFLTAGRGSMLRPIDNETYEAENGGRIRRALLKGVCP
jgi:hypothetical protein